MSMEKGLFRFAGSMVIVSGLLSMFHDPRWVWFTLFIGANMIQSTYTGICPPSWVMRRMGMRTEAEIARDGRD